MSMWIPPPGRTSTSHTGLVNWCGPHQRASIVGSVHALNTSDRGASNTRVIVRIGYLEAFVSAVGFIAWSFLDVLEKIVEAIEPRIPEAAVVLEPARCCPQRPAVDPAWPPLRRL